MKFLLTIFCLTLLHIQCATKKINETEKITFNKEAVFIYKHYTRGFYKEHHIKEGKLTTYLDYKKKEFIEKEITTMDWVKCLELLTKIDLAEFVKLEAQSGLRHTDKVQHGELTLKINKATFRSRGFDHGNPPQDIKPLVNHLLYLSEGEVFQN